jgi:hypothetical protein
MPRPINEGADAIDLSPRFVRSAVVVASPAAAAETIIAQTAAIGDVAVMQGVTAIGLGRLYGRHERHRRHGSPSADERIGHGYCHDGRGDGWDRSGGTRRARRRRLRRGGRCPVAGVRADAASNGGVGGSTVSAVMLSGLVI